MILFSAAPGWARGLLADYGVPLMVVAWSGLSFAVSTGTTASNGRNKSDVCPSLEAVPAGIPRRITTPHVWDVQASAPLQRTFVAAELG
jgi:hypothetical protein